MSTARRTALISGSARGIGHEIARQLLALDHDVIVTARDLDTATRAAADLGAGARGVALETTDAAGVAALAADLTSLDVLVNNAGITGDDSSSVATADLDDARHTMEVNLFGGWRLTQALLPLLRASDAGRIVFLSTGMGQLSEMGGGAPAYRISKTAVNALTKTLSVEEAAHGILVNALNPGWVQTDMGGASAPRTVAEGADTAVWLATLPDDGPTGGFFKDRELQPW